MGTWLKQDCYQKLATKSCVVNLMSDLVCMFLVQINNGVYKSGFSTTQAAYNKAQQELYSALDVVEQRLSQHRFLVGNK